MRKHTLNKSTKELKKILQSPQNKNEVIEEVLQKNLLEQFTKIYHLFRQVGLEKLDCIQIAIEMYQEDTTPGKRKFIESSKEDAINPNTM
ncbi:MAG: hypothetical protein K2W92_02695 [Alphaproteobacteria bacterium]|nr:hypothetical protein [Alphaproteobacteria bacterium]